MEKVHPHTTNFDYCLPLLAENLFYADVSCLELNLAQFSCDLQEIELTLDNQNFLPFREEKEI